MQAILFLHRTAESLEQQTDQHHRVLPKHECKIIVKKTVREALHKIETLTVSDLFFVYFMTLTMISAL